MTHQLPAGDLTALPALPSDPLADIAAPFARLADAAASGFLPDPDLTVSEWADTHRVLSSKAAPEPGPYRTSRAPMLREIMDALSPRHPAQRISFIKGSQIGGSEAGNNWLGFIIAHAPGPIIAVQPTVELAKRFSKQRLDPMIESTPALRRIVRPARARDSGNTILQKDFPGGTLVLTGANSAVGLRSMPARYAFLDEVDAYPADVEGEGDPVALAEARTKTYGYRKKIFLVSTPKLAGTSRIEREYLASDQRRYFVPCPHCAHMQPLRFEQLRWDRGNPQTVGYYCEECGVAASEANKTDMLARGEWHATAVSKDPLTIGFHISSLYSPVGWMSWVEIAAAWEKAQEAGPEALRAFKNTVLGEVWQEQGEAPDWERLIERREPYPMGVVPSGAVVLTAGVDVQRDRLEADIWAWGPGLESWLVDSRSLPGDPTERPVWDALAGLLGKDWPREGGGTLRIEKAGVDTGGTDTQATYAALRRAHDPRLMPLKGVEGWNRASPVNGPTLVDVTEGGRKLRRGLKLWTVTVSTFKADLYRRLQLTRGDGVGFPPGWVHLPEGLEAEAVRQLVAEQLVTVKDKRGFARMEWRKLRDRNERLDCAVYARAALTLLGVDRYGDRFWVKYEREATAEEPAAVASPSPAAVVALAPSAVPSTTKISRINRYA